MNYTSSVVNIQKYVTVRIHATTNEMASVKRLAFLVETPMKAQNNYLKWTSATDSTVRQFKLNHML